MSVDSGQLRVDSYVGDGLARPARTEFGLTNISGRSKTSGRASPSPTFAHIK